MSSGLQCCCCSMSVLIPDMLDSFLRKFGYLPCVKSGIAHDARYLNVKLAGGTRAFVDCETRGEPGPSRSLGKG